VRVRDASSRDTYEWSGSYRPAIIQPSFEVVLAVAAAARGARVEKLKLDGLRKQYGSHNVVGVIRPGRPENRGLYGVTFGLRLATGQVKSLFTRDEARAICNWVLTESELPYAVRDTSYMFEFPAEAFTRDSDKGRTVGFCRET
jgi:hypothetical protein